MASINLSGVWAFELDPQKKGMPVAFSDTMMLPGTTSNQQKGEVNHGRETHFLTDTYKYEGYAWFKRSLTIQENEAHRYAILYLERTRKTTVWIDGQLLGSEDSLSTPHQYRLNQGLSEGEHDIVICVDNTDYPTKGGHLTSQDTQTNWNGITGRIELCLMAGNWLENIKMTPSFEPNQLQVTACLQTRETQKQIQTQEFSRTSDKHSLKVQILGMDGDHAYLEHMYDIEGEQIEIIVPLDDTLRLWSEFDPYLYEVRLTLNGQEAQSFSVGFRSFQGKEDKFEINGYRTFLRGKHDGLIFPLTGFAPTEVETWLDIMGTAKAYGVNHYRFHTSCPPEAAFIAADQLGIYMEPELPFWGTIHSKTSKEFNAIEYAYLMEEGKRILDTFGHHPSFVMMSLGNELWGDPETINEMIKTLKAHDARPLFTQGSNNFQFMPMILEEDDFYCGVRFSKERLIRGSYAMCDAPLGHIQTDEPSTRIDYDGCFEAAWVEAGIDKGQGLKEIEIQYETGVKKVQVEERSGFVPRVPVISHEIGQYETYPDFDEIQRYTGSLKARNFEIFRERLEAKGLGDLAKDYFYNSGRLAMACYKEELEAVIRSRYMAGFQLLDLQDFSGQGTALVGVLDAFMSSKGLISEEGWRQFCSDMVVLARFHSYQLQSGTTWGTDIQLAKYRPIAISSVTLKWSFQTEDGLVSMEGSVVVDTLVPSGVMDLVHLELYIPEVMKMTKGRLALEIEELEVTNSYEFTVYPKVITLDTSEVREARSQRELEEMCQSGETILYFPDHDEMKDALEATYATDFWCYPMFRSISESMNKPTPIGTMGLLIQKEHLALAKFPCETYTTPQWYDILCHSRLMILDEISPAIRPIVQMIDNFERNHRLGLLYEYAVGEAQVVVCTANPDKLMRSMSGKQFLASLYDYVRLKQE